MCRRFSLGGPDDYAISPDGKEVCFTMNTDEVGPSAPITICSWWVSMATTRQSAAHHAQCRVGQFAAVFAGRQIHRLSLAGPRRIRERSLAPAGDRTRDRED